MSQQALRRWTLGFVAGLLVLAASGGAGLPLASQRAAAAPLTQIPRAGYQAGVSGNATVTTTFVMPTVSNCPATFAGVAAGAAIFGSSGHLVAGIQLLCNFGTPGYLTFIQLNGVGTGLPDLPAAGDLIKVTIALTPAAVQATVADLTAGWSETRSNSGGTATAAAAGIIGSCAPAPRFSTTSFSASSINGASLTPGGAGNLVSTDGILEAFPSALSASGTAFTAAWAATAGSCAPTVSATTLLGPPGSNSGVTSAPPACAVGDPVVCATGDLAESASDLSVPGRGRSLNWSRTYNSLLAATAGRLGNGWTDSYAESLALDGSGNATVQFGTGASLTFAPDGAGGYVSGAAITAALSGNAATGWTMNYKDLRSDRFGPGGRLLSESDRTGEATTLSYDGAGRLTAVTDPAGRSLRLSYDAAGRVTSLTDPESRTVRYTYDAAGNLAGAVDVAGDSVRYAYDAAHNLTSVTDPLGRVTKNSYDGANRVLAQTDPAGAITTFAYSGSGGDGSTTVTDPTGLVTVENFAGYLLTSLTRASGGPLEATWSYGYDSHADPTSMTDPNGNTWSATYDALGNRLTATDPLGRTATFSYTATNDPATTTDPAGVTTTYSYDAHHLLVRTSTPINGSSTAVTTIARADAAHPGDATAVTDTDGRTTHYLHDAGGDLTRTTNAKGESAGLSFDTVGRIRTATDPLGKTMRYETDAFGRVTEITDPLGQRSSVHYDGDGEITSSTDATDATAHLIYDPDGRVLVAVDARGGRTTATYDAAGDRTSVTDGAGHTTRYGFDALHRLTSVTDGLGEITAFSYDQAGRQTGLTDPTGRVATWSFDGANQVIGLHYSDGVTPDVSSSYDADGRRLTMTDGTGTSSYAYDGLGRMTAATDGSGATVSYALDAAGLLTALSYPGGGSVSYSYDAAGRLSGLSDWLGHHFSFSADADGLFSSQTSPDGSTTTIGRNADQSVTSIDLTKGGDPLARLSYGRDAVQRVSSSSAELHGGPGRPDNGADNRSEYDYTRNGQLSSAGDLRFGYDAAGDLTQLGGATQQFNATAELVSRRSDSAMTAFTYDALGNRTGAVTTRQPGENGNDHGDNQGDGHGDEGNRGHDSPTTTPLRTTSSYSYDQASRLTKITTQSGSGPAQTTASFGYNGYGLRSSATTPAGSQQFTWDIAAPTPLLLADGANRYIYGPGGVPVEQLPLSGGPALYLHQDQLGSTVIVTDGAGKVVSSPTYGPYGAPDSKAPQTVTPFGFAGGYTDASGLIYLLHRYYDPATGVFLTPDAGWPTSGGYQYAGGDPINASDPSGRSTSPPPYTTSYIPPGQTPPPYTAVYTPPGQASPPYTSNSLPPGQTPPPYGSSYIPPPSPAAPCFGLPGGAGYSAGDSGAASYDPGSGGSVAFEGGGSTSPVLTYDGAGGTLPVLTYDGVGGSLPVLTYDGAGGTLPVLTFEGGGSTLPVLAGSQGGSTLPVLTFEGGGSTLPV